MCMFMLISVTLVAVIFLGPILATSFPSLAERTEFFIHQEINESNDQLEQFQMKNEKFHPYQVQNLSNDNLPTLNSQRPAYQQQQHHDQQQQPMENPPLHMFMPSVLEPLSAAAKLQCPASILSFVINATDIKDECEGLRKAFDKTCGGHPSGKREKTDLGTRRRLSAFESIGSLNNDNRHKGSMRNPVRDYLKRRLDSLKHREVQDFHKLPRYEGAQLEDENVQPSVQEKKDEPISPSLPTSSLVLEESALNDSLTLHADLKDIAKAIEDITNHTEYEERGEEKHTHSGRKQKHEHTTAAEEHAEELKSTAVAVSAVINSPEVIETQACCRSILQVFHEECDSPEEEEFNDKRLFVIVLVIALCGLVKSLIRHFKLFWLPEAGGCILVGMFGGLFLRFLPSMDFGFQHDMFLRLMVPPIGKWERMKTFELN